MTEEPAIAEPSLDSPIPSSTLVISIGAIPWSPFNTCHVPPVTYLSVTSLEI